MSLFSQALNSDPWLSQCLDRACFRADPHGLAELSKVEFDGMLPSGRSFVFTKCPSKESEALWKIQQLGFYVVDTSIVFSRNGGEMKVKNKFPTRLFVRAAQPEDRVVLSDLAGRAFRYSRFHLDPQFTAEEAFRIKSLWAENFFDGKRGDGMLIAEKDGATTGFLLYLEKGKLDAVIDLIGVDPAVQRSGAGKALVDSLQQLYPGGSIHAGTQIANTISIEFYQKNGFRMRAAEFVLHYHK